MRKNAYISGILLLTAFLLWSGIGPIRAWYTDQEQKINRFSVGNNEIQIKEEFPDPGIEPGKTTVKTVRIENTGKVSCFVRAELYFSDDHAEESIVLNYGSDKWKKEEDGFYYYQDSIPPGEMTEPLITGLTLKEGYRVPENFDLFVYADSVQSEGHAAPLEAFSFMEGGRIV